MPSTGGREKGLPWRTKPVSPNTSSSMERGTILVLSGAGEKGSCDVKSDSRWQDECHQEAKQNQKSHFIVGGERQASPAACMESIQHGGRAREGRAFLASVLADPLGPAPPPLKRGLWAVSDCRLSKTLNHVGVPLQMPALFF